MKTKLLYLLVMLLVLVPLLGAYDADVAYARKPTKQPKPTKPTRTPKPPKPTKTPRPTVIPTSTSTMVPTETLTPTQPTITEIPESQAVPVVPLWIMYNIENGGRWCLIVSRIPPSVERQKILCGWIADKSLFGWVMSDDSYVHDHLPFLRLPLHSADGSKDLMDVWNK